MVQNCRFSYKSMKKKSKKNLYILIYTYIANIVCKKWFLFQVEIKEKCCLSPYNGPKQQMKPHPTR